MSWVSIEGLRVAFGSTEVLDGVSLEIPRGSLVAVLGPSGCGKTTMLRAIAGLLPASGGTIQVGDAVLTSPNHRIAPEKRGIGWVPQDASLFPHLTVGENIGFGMPRGKRAERVAELAAMVGLSDAIDRDPSKLSGGQAQRVSLARALAPSPQLVLLDEPFAALDPQLRTSLRREVADLLTRQGSTSILVTHDQEEALSLADYVAVMRDGRILQWGTPAEIYERPADRWVANFVGDTVELEGHWAGGRVECALGLLDATSADDARRPEGAPANVMLRPEWVRLGADGVAAIVTAVAYAGHDALVTVTLESGMSVRARVAAPNLPKCGDHLRVAVRHPVLAYPANGEHSAPFLSTAGDTNSFTASRFHTEVTTLIAS